MNLRYRMFAIHNQLPPLIIVCSLLGIWRNASSPYAIPTFRAALNGAQRRTGCLKAINGSALLRTFRGNALAQLTDVAHSAFHVYAFIHAFSRSAEGPRRAENRARVYRDTLSLATYSTYWTKNCRACGRQTSPWYILRDENLVCFWKWIKTFIAVARTYGARRTVLLQRKDVLGTNFEAYSTLGAGYSGGYNDSFQTTFGSNGVSDLFKNIDRYIFGNDSCNGVRGVGVLGVENGCSEWSQWGTCTSKSGGKQSK